MSIQQTRKQASVESNSKANINVDLRTRTYAYNVKKNDFGTQTTVK